MSPATSTPLTAAASGAASGSPVSDASATSTTVPSTSAASRGTVAHRANAVPCGARTSSCPSQPWSPCRAERTPPSGAVAHPVCSARAPAGAPRIRCTRSSYRPRTTVTLSTRSPGTVGAPPAKTGVCQDAAHPQPSP